ncbi:hypothetical protein [Pseudomonas guariconensis]|uniref:hypothetical protein n=1 Tax=Pseudomonas guariconensis TaxID=1288410 RepID=UPI0039062568
MSHDQVVTHSPASQSDPKPFGWVVNSPKGLEPVEAFTRDPHWLDQYQAMGWPVVAVATVESVEELHRELRLSNLNYRRLLDYANETERQRAEAVALLKEIAKSGQAYSECTDRGSRTGRRIEAVVAYGTVVLG